MIDKIFIVTKQYTFRLENGMEIDVSDLVGVFYNERDAKIMFDVEKTHLPNEYAVSEYKKCTLCIYSQTIPDKQIKVIDTYCPF